MYTRDSALSAHKLELLPCTGRVSFYTYVHNPDLKQGRCTEADCTVSASCPRSVTKQVPNKVSTFI